MGFNLDDLSVDKEGETFVTKNLSPDQKAMYSSMKAAFGVYTLNKGVNAGVDPEDPGEFLDFVNSSYGTADDANSAVEDIKNSVPKENQ